MMRSAVRHFRQPRRIIYSYFSTIPTLEVENVDTKPKATNNTQRIPTKHSRKRLPPACLDPTELSERTQEILEAPEGTLYSYVPGKDTRDDAWKRADETVQLAEYLIRGHTWNIPFTTYHRWVMNGKGEPTQEIETSLKQITAIVDRLYDEGISYMSLRAARLEELDAQNQKAPDTLMIEGQEIDFSDLEENDEDEELEENDFESADDLDKETEAFAEEEQVQADDIKVLSSNADYIHDFASPGLTTHMFNLLLDSMACSNVADPKDAQFYLSCLTSRHEFDGGDADNRNPFTCIDVMSANACIRVAASARRDNEVRHRDEAIELAFAAFDVLNQSKIVRPNSATYEYLLQVIGKSFPASRSRGNIAFGLLEQAREEGLWNGNVIKSFLEANEPSNGEEFDAYIQKYLKDRAMKDIPERFRHKSFVRQYLPREATY